MAKIIAVCISDRKGIKKLPVESGVFRQDYGMEGDAHANPDDEKRQISLLAIESIQKMNSEGFSFQPGDFAENLTISGIELNLLPVGTRLKIGRDILLEVTQIGKKCHAGCAIFQKAGKCIMPKEGVFARVIRGGTVTPGDNIEVAV